MKTKPQTLELLAGQLTDDQIESLNELGTQMLTCFDSFQQEDLIKFGARKSVSLSNRQLMVKWSKAWIAKCIELKAIEEVIPSVYDEPVYRVKAVV
jgi:hypothetical protein